MKKVLLYLKSYWKFALLAALLMGVEVTMDLLQPKLMEKIIDIGIAGMNLDFVLKTCLLMIGITIIGLFGGVGCSIFSTIAAQNIGADLRNDLFTKIQSFSFKNLDELNTGNLITVLTNDINTIQRIIMMGLAMMVRSPLLVIGSFIMAIITIPKLSWIIVLITPIIVTVLLTVNKRVYPLFYKVQQKLDQINTVIQENLAGIRVVKAFVRSNHEKERFRQSNEDYMLANITANQTMAVVMPLMILILNLAIVAVVWFGGIEINQGNLQAGSVIAFINYLMRLLQSLTMLGMVLIDISRATVSANRVENILKIEPTIKADHKQDDTFEIKGQIIFEDVSFSYDEDGEPTLSNLNFTIEAGETVGILGETGSGKSTLIQLIPRLYDVSSGRILIDGRDITEISPKTLRKQIGLVLQEAILFSGTIKENIGFGTGQISDQEMVEAAQIAQAEEFISSFKDSYDSPLSQRGVNLSGGQKQRLSIARTLALKTPILIFDDSTSAVDTKTESLILEALQQKRKDTTNIIIAQRISSIIEADKILVLEDGQITAIGNHQELLAISKIYQDIYNSQFAKEEKNYA
jgi:ATP-binding cassette subfamily B protein